LPEGVVSRAKEILATLEHGDSAPLPSSEYPGVEASISASESKSARSGQKAGYGENQSRSEKNRSLST
jgi:hypothetical protein